jgi:hypothetical protein
MSPNTRPLSLRSIQRGREGWGLSLAPGIGEIIGGSEREERLDLSDRSMAERRIDKEASAGTATCTATVRSPQPPP